MKLELSSPHPTPAQIARLYAQLTTRMTPMELTRRSEECKPLLREHIRMGRALLPHLSATEVVMIILPRLEIAQSLSKSEFETLLLLLLWLATQLTEKELAPTGSVEVTPTDLAIWHSVMAQAQGR